MSTRIVGVAIILASLLTGCGVFSKAPADPYATVQDPAKVEPYSANTTPPATSPSASNPYGANPTPDTQPANNGAGTGLLMQALSGTLFSGGRSSSNNDSAGGGGGKGGGPAAIGVNSFLWRASLDTVSFMPLASADPFGGVIITDWYSPAETPNERFKLNVLILGRELRADGLRANIFRQKRDANGQWADAPVDQNTGTDIENAILTRARQIRLSAASR